VVRRGTLCMGRSTSRCLLSRCLFRRAAGWAVGTPPFPFVASALRRESCVDVRALDFFSPFFFFRAYPCFASALKSSFLNCTIYEPPMDEILTFHLWSSTQCVLTLIRRFRSFAVLSFSDVSLSSPCIMYRIETSMSTQPSVTTSFDGPHRHNSFVALKSFLLP